MLVASVIMRTRVRYSGTKVLKHVKRDNKVCPLEGGFVRFSLGVHVRDVFDAVL